MQYDIHKALHSVRFTLLFSHPHKKVIEVVIENINPLFPTMCERVCVCVCGCGCVIVNVGAGYIGL